MNYLAHTLLSKNHADYQLGNLLADTLKGEAWVGASPLHIDGLVMHKKIDKFTDNSQIVQSALAQLGRGYLKGVVLDITFDYFLSKHWHRFVCVDKATFISDFYQGAALQSQSLPNKAESFINNVINYDVLNSYNSMAELEVVFHRVNRRLSARLLAKESITDYLPKIADNYDELERYFLQFFPTLVQLFLDQSQLKDDEHCLIV